MKLMPNAMSFLKFEENKDIHELVEENKKLQKAISNTDSLVDKIAMSRKIAENNSKISKADFKKY